MRINGTAYHVTKARDSENKFYTNLNGNWNVVDPACDEAVAAIKELYVVAKRSARMTAAEIYGKVNQLKPIIVAHLISKRGEAVKAPEVSSAPDASELVRELMAFMSEFHFEPNFRFINTLAFANAKGRDEARKYITNYFRMIDSPYTSSVEEKLKSREFKDLLERLAEIVPSKTINKRLRLYFGSQGTGKTTKAIDEASECMVCHSAILPQDLMEDFKFIDGKPNFQPSALQKAMTHGDVIVLDEINLLPFESLRFLQTILDGKEEFEYKGKTIKIADGFEIIGTMNLVVNGCTYALPEPLVDRASELREFVLTADDLAAALA